MSHLPPEGRVKELIVTRPFYLAFRVVQTE